MLIRSFLPMPIEGFLHNIPDPGVFHMCPKCDEDPPGGCSKAVSVMEEKRKPNGSCSLSNLKSTDESSLSTVSETGFPNFVYKRKNRRGGPENVALDKAPVDVRRIGDCYSTISFNASLGEKEAGGAPILTSLDLDAKPTSGWAGTQEHGPDEKPIRAYKIIDVDSLNDSCSSRSNADPVSVPLKAATEETGECSSSSVIAIEAQEDSPLSERDICISILQSEGLLERAKSSSSSASKDGNEISTTKSCRASFPDCKACGRSESARKMLICDFCDDAFHLSCCDSRMRNFRDNDEWFCTSCRSKKQILVRQTGMKCSGNQKKWVLWCTVIFMFAMLINLQHSALSAIGYNASRSWTTEEKLYVESGAGKIGLTANLSFREVSLLQIPLPRSVLYRTMRLLTCC
ncbi:uncharacterized protein LOC116187938 isoform X7 [Punica granatum]|uniref:Uncharacterized protein LOC116187938 isoform X7 n=1 Tax=Punica granatum TaxID=22663 RepID=A0A6P8BRS0_PUNGR|nr:uncharacterized protein LOC116187938 isoform X7 [Punica granatum]